MRLNNKIIKVIMPYSKDIVFTPGDIIFNDDLIMRVCIKEGANSFPTNFTPMRSPFSISSSIEQAKLNPNNAVSYEVMNLYLNEVILGYSAGGNLTEYPGSDLDTLQVICKYKLPESGIINHLPQNLDRSRLNFIDVAVDNEAVYQEIISINPEDNSTTLFFRNFPKDSITPGNWISTDSESLKEIIQSKFSTYGDSMDEVINRENEVIDALIEPIVKILLQNAAVNSTSFYIDYNLIDRSSSNIYQLMINYSKSGSSNIYQSVTTFSDTDLTDAAINSIKLDSSSLMDVVLNSSRLNVSISNGSIKSYKLIKL